MGFRTKEKKQAEARQYARGACPYGDAQREKLTELLAAILLQGRIGIEMARYIALIEADAQVDETLNYPTPDALMAAGDELLQWLKAHKQAIKR